jgi:putative transposase
MKYAFILKNRSQWPVSILCEVLDVSPSGYNVAEQRKRGKAGNYQGIKRISNDLLLANIRTVHAASKGEYGWPRVWKALLQKGIQVGKERVRRLMSQHNIWAKHKRKFRVTTDSKHNLPIAPNLLERNFTTPEPNQVWTTDLTYIQTKDGWLYLVAFIDLYSRMIVGWSLQPHMRSEMVVDALRMAWFRRKQPRDVIVHSDRGSQYCGQLFQDALKAYGMKSSMSRKGDCWDNSPTESLWGKLKVARIHGEPLRSADETRQVVMDWVHFYNSTRLHSSLGYLSPMQFEKLSLQTHSGQAA